jgi:hypothetical protein
VPVIAIEILDRLGGPGPTQPARMIIDVSSSLGDDLCRADRVRIAVLLKANAAPRCGARSKRTGKPCRGCGHAERALQASWWQEHGAAHNGGPRAQQASKLETRALFAGSQGGTVARAGGNLSAKARFACFDVRIRVTL